MTQKAPHGILVTALFACIAPALMSGCENAEARQRAEVQKALAEAGLELQRARTSAFTSEDAGSAEVLASLRQVLQKIDSVAGAPGGLAATQSSLASATLREMAIVGFSQAEVKESEHRRERDVLAAKLGTMVRIAGQAAGLDEIAIEDIRDSLRQQRETAESGLGQYSSAMAELDGPITEAQQENSADAAEVTRLLEQANQAWQFASAQGSAKGFAQYLEGWQLTREADRLEYRIANREAVLSYELKPEHELAGTRAEHARGLLEWIDASQSRLSDFESLKMDQSAALRRLVDERKKSIDDSLKALRASVKDELEPLYADVETHLDRAATEAMRSGGGSGGNMDAARVHELRGRLFWSQASGLQHHLSLLTQLKEASDDVGTFEGLDADLAATTAAQIEAIEKAREAYNEAKSAIEGAEGMDGAVLRNALDSAIAGLGGDFTAIPMPVMENEESVAEAAPAPAASEAAPGGFATPEGVIDAMIQAARGEDPMAQLAVYRARDARGEKAVSDMRATAQLQADLNAAMEETFGRGAKLSSAQMGLGSMPLDRNMFEEQSRTEDEVVYLLMGQISLPVVRIDGAWYADPGFYAELTNMMSAQGMDLNAMTQATHQVLRDLAQRVRDGEFSSAGEVNDAFMQEIARAMGQGG